ncbi:MAG: ATP-dependent Clp protease ATP-binding subunit [Mycoplasma sp.]
MKFEENNLEKFGRNLTKEVKENKNDPVIGRTSEIRRIIEILSRKTKNNPVLIGEPGVGKTAVIEGLAQKIVSGDVPNDLKDKEIWDISVSSIMAGAGIMGQFQQRVKDILEIVQKSNGKIILFIDEIHQIVGAGKSGSGDSMDIANILKPMMARGEIKIIGATTLQEYRTSIETDSALERRVSKVMINEPTQEETLTILRGLKSHWEVHHEVEISDSALVAAVELSERYITDRFLPDKAIDLIDEAAARIKTTKNSLPIELEEIQKRIGYLKVEKHSLKTEDSPTAKKRLLAIKEELEKLNIQEKDFLKAFEEEKQNVSKLSEAKNKLISLEQKSYNLQTEGKFEEVSKINYETIPALKNEIASLKEILKQSKIINNVVTKQEIAEVISKSIGIPMDNLLKGEKEKLTNLFVELQENVIGQDNALEVVSNTIKRSRMGINDPNRPIGSFLFLGSTGVGKTEVAKTLANNIFDTEKAMVRVDMSEFMDKHSISKLIGTTAGFVGYNDETVFEKIRRKPYSIILLDEIEKAHPDVLNLFLQILDDGFVKDGKGRLINFKNTIIIMTSNVGSLDILDNNNEKAMEQVRSTFKSEFLNRIDNIIIFKPLEKEMMLKVIDKFLKQIALRLSQKEIKLTWTNNLKEFILDKGFVKEYGARSVKRFIQNLIENKLADWMLEDKMLPQKQYTIDFSIDKQELTIKETKMN